MIEQRSMAGDLTDALCSLLELHPGDVDVHRSVVLTTDPDLWSTRREDRDLRILDLSGLLHVRPVQAPGEMPST